MAYIIFIFLEFPQSETLYIQLFLNINIFVIIFPQEISNYQHYSQQLQPYCNRKIQGFSVKRLNNLRNSLSLFTAKLHFICIQMISYLSKSQNFQKTLPWCEFQFQRYQACIHQQKLSVSKSLCGMTERELLLRHFAAIRQLPKDSTALQEMMAFRVIILST